MKFVGTSNSVLLVPPSDQPGYPVTGVASAIKAAPGVMELVEVAPRLDKLKTLLFENPYRTDDEEMEGSEKGLYKWEDLASTVQASDEELRSGLEALSALEIGGHWRVVDESYMDVMLRMLLNNSVLNDWSLESLDQNRVVDVLCSDGYPLKLAEHCLRVYGVKVSEGAAESGPVWKLDEKRVCVHFARQILRGGKIRMESLVEEMDRKTPESMRASFEMLEGEVLTERFGVDTWVRGFSVSSLPSTPPERFSALFTERQKWEWKDLEPYVRYIVFFFVLFSFC